MLERSANFIETRRDPTNNLFLAGPAGNLLAPSYAGWHRPDGSYDKAYLAGLSITYIAALDRLIEVEKLAARKDQAALYSQRRDQVRRGLPLLTADEGYFIRSLDPDGVKHGVYGAERHGYFEASPNHDAIALRVADDTQADQIYRKMASLPGLRPHDFVLPNYPSYDDMYEKPEGLWAYGTWVNGGHWSTCEARMVLAYYRLGKFDDARKSMRQLLTFAERFRMDNPLTKGGSDVYQPNQPINLCYDTLGPAAAFMRGLFEYIYRADGLALVPHVPPTITELDQCDPVRFGDKRLLLSTVGSGPITAVRVNGRKWTQFTQATVSLPYSTTPGLAKVEIVLGGATIKGGRASSRAQTPPSNLESQGSRGRSPSPFGEAPLSASADLATLNKRAVRMQRFERRLTGAGLGASYEAEHARLATDCIAAVRERRELIKDGKIKPLPQAREAAADRCYVETATKLCDGLEVVLKKYENAGDPQQRHIYELWARAAD
jgi:hypothetical protein